MCLFHFDKKECFEYTWLEMLSIGIEIENQRRLTNNFPEDQTESWHWYLLVCLWEMKCISIFIEFEFAKQPFHPESKQTDLEDNNKTMLKKIQPNPVQRKPWNQNDKNHSEKTEIKVRCISFFSFVWERKGKVFLCPWKCQ